MQISDVIEAMELAGISAEQILKAVKLLPQPELRSRGALRQERHRRKKASLTVTERNEVSLTVTERNEVSPSVTSVTGDDSLLPPCPPSSLFPNPLPSIPLNPPSSGGDTPQTTTPKLQKRGERLRIDWDLPEDWGEWAEQQGMSRDSIIRECDKFKDFWIAKVGPNATKADWSATWRNWIRKHLEGYVK